MIDALLSLSGPYAIDCAALDQLEDLRPSTKELIDALHNPGGRGYSVEGDVAVVALQGILSKYPDPMTKLQNGTALMEVANELREAAADRGVAGICLEINSPGGSLRGMSQVGDAIRFARSHKPVVASIGAAGCGTALAIAVQCDAVFAAPQAKIGAVGVQIVEAFPTWCVVTEKRQTQSSPFPIFRAGQPAAWQFETGLTEEDLAMIAHFDEELKILFESQRPQLDLAVYARLAAGASLNAEQIETSHLIDGILPRDAVIDRVRRGDPSIKKSARI